MKRSSQKHFKLTVAYDGTNYGGWQLQPNTVTIQGLLETALKKIAGKRVVVHGSGRTDAGVHARAQVASCRLITHHRPPVLRRALNANLPEDVRVLRVQEVTARFHARFSARAKDYRYQIDCGIVADPFRRMYAWHHPRPLNLIAMRRAARLLVGRHDFTALSAKSERTPVRMVKRLTITKQGNLVTITVAADGFLYKMVRSIVGALVKVGEGKLTVEELRDVLRRKKRVALIETAPAKGLFLWEVWY
ncbi:MAG TPA: tRNA pseudouridine(38-40) synthase TruA [Verrucomicrobiae bacterium]|nr:tRNA pseudouridine(38-40) synthase TruA [Verrucomicrobiae bacterium]